MIYLDYAAATPLSDKALQAMTPYFSEQFFNPSSPYLAAKHVREAYEDAKDRIAHCIGAKGNDIIITSGATESINLAFKSLEAIISDISPIRTKSEKMQSKKTKSEEDKTKEKKIGKIEPEVLILETEHASVRAAASKYATKTIKVDKYGLIDQNDLKSKITDNTALISVSFANNELGTIQPLAEISEIIKKIRLERLQNGNKMPIYFHSDASQALSLIDFSVARIGVDMLTINAAKVYGPKGVGALYVAHGVKLQPIALGGGQERGLRSGTENVAGVMGFAAAAEEAKAHITSNRKKYEKLVEVFKKELQDAKVEPVFLAHPKKHLANFCPVSFEGVDAERIIYMLEMDEIYLSTGAACAASKGQKSHVLTAIGLSDEKIAGSLRISLGALNDENQVREAAKAIVSAVNVEYERTHDE